MQLQTQEAEGTLWEHTAVLFCYSMKNRILVSCFPFCSLLLPLLVPHLRLCGSCTKNNTFYK